MQLTPLIHCMSVVPGPGVGGQYKEITFDPRAINGIPGVPGELTDNELDLSNSEAEENSTGCSKTLETGDDASKGTSKVPREGISGNKSSLAGPPSLQGSSENGKCSDTREPNPGRPDTEIQN